MTESFHGMARARKASRPTITVTSTETELKSPLESFGLRAIDFAIGEPDLERVVLHVSKPGTFTFPANVQAGERIAARRIEIAGETVTRKIAWPHRDDFSRLDNRR